jgi:hypothetical protein
LAFRHGVTPSRAMVDTDTRYAWAIRDSGSPALRRLWASARWNAVSTGGLPNLTPAAIARRLPSPVLSRIIAKRLWPILPPLFLQPQSVSPVVMPATLNIDIFEDAKPDKKQLKCLRNCVNLPIEGGQAY